jgi:hypothetical protein
VLVQARWRQHVARRRPRERHRVAGRRHHRVPLPDLDDRVEAELGRVRDALVEGVDRRARDAGREQLAEPLVAGARREPRLEQRAQCVAVRRAVLVVREPRVVEQLRRAEHLAEAGELPVVAGDDDDVAVRRRQRLVREQARVRVAHAVGHCAARDVRARVVHEPGQRGRQQVHLDVLAEPGRLPVPQGGQDADDRLHAGHDVEHRDPGAVRRPVRVAGQAHQAGQRLHHEVVARHRGTLAGAEAADRGIDDALVGGRDAVVVQAVLRQAAGAEVLDDDVGPRGQLAGERGVAGVAQVERDRALVAVDREVVRRDVAAHRRLPGAGVVAGRALHLDDLGAHVAEQHRRVGAGEDPGEVGHEEPVERSCRLAVHRATLPHGCPLYGQPSDPSFDSTRTPVKTQSGPWPAAARPGGRSRR